MVKFSLEKARIRSKKFNEKLERIFLSDPEAKAQYEQKRREIELALTLRKAREEADVTQEDLATRLHTTKSAISRLESCGLTRSTPSFGTILKYADALGYDVQLSLIPRHI